MKSTESKTRILLVDDEEHLLVTLRDFLSFEGYGVLLARSGEEALSKIAEQPPDLIILDVSMPGMGGIGFLKRANGNRKLPCPVLILTARANMKEFFADMDVAGFLAKPCTKEELLGKIQAVLEQRAADEKPERRGRLRVLIGEDDPRIVEGLQGTFRGAGYDVSFVGTGPEVLERATTEKPDAVLVKGVLANMNGEAIASILKVMPGTRKIPLVLYDTTGRWDGAAGKALTPPNVTRFVRSAAGFDLLNALNGVFAEEKK